MAVYIIYPDRRWVDDATITGWYDDAAEDDRIALGHQKARTVEDMARALEDVGMITRGKPPAQPWYGTTVLLAGILLFTASQADAATRCRTSRSGSVTYTTCEGDGGKTDCRSSRSGSTTYTTCQRR